MGRRLGQHFLTDPAILDRIVAALRPTLADTVLEIGAGRGSLTHRLAAKVGRVIALERDPGLMGDLRSGLVGGTGDSVVENVALVEADALAIDWHGLLDEVTAPFKVIGNIPYYITSPLIDKALTPPVPRVIVMLVQRDVADRLAAQPGGKTYGALSVGVQSVAQVERMFTVKPGSFQPPPKVDSTVVRITPLSDPLVALSEREPFRGFVTALFSQRRKQLGRGIRGICGGSREQVAQALRDSGFDATQRAEALPAAEIVRLFRAFGR